MDAGRGQPRRSARGRRADHGHRQCHARLVLGRRAVPGAGRRDRARAAPGGRGSRNPRHRRGIYPPRGGAGVRRRGARARDPGRRGAGRRRPRDLDRHHEGLRRPRGPLRRSHDRERRLGAAVRPRACGRRRRGASDLRPHAHAGRAPHDAGRPALRRRRLRGEGFPRGATRLRGCGGDRTGADLARPRDRVRQDAGAQPDADRAPRRDRGDRSAGRVRRLS